MCIKLYQATMRVLLAVILMASLIPIAQAQLVNGGFESGDLTGWSVVIPDGGYINVVAAGSGETAIEGNFFANMKTDGPGSFTTLSQAFNAGLGMEISGYAFFLDQEFLQNQPCTFQDSMSVDIMAGATVVANVFYTQHCTDGVNFDDGSLPWTLWSYTFDGTEPPGPYTVMARITNIGDSNVDSTSGVDGLELTGVLKTLSSGPDRDGDGNIDLVVPVGVDNGEPFSPVQYDFTLTYNDPDNPLVWIYDTLPAEWDVTDVEFDPTGLPLACGEATEFAGNYGMVDIWRGGKIGKKCESDTSFRWMPATGSSGVSRFYWTDGWTSGPLAGPQGTVNRINADGTGATVLATTAASGGPLYRVTDVEIDQSRNALYFTNWHSGPQNSSADEAIYRTDLDGAGQVVFSTSNSNGAPGASGLHRLAVDPANGDVYFTRAVSYANPGEVSRVDVAGAGYTQLIGASDGWFFSGVALDNTNGLVYFGDGGVLLIPPINGSLNVMDKTGAAAAVLVPNGNGNGMGKTVAYDGNYGVAGTAFYSGWNICDIFLGPGCGGGDLYAYDVATGVSTLIYSDPASGIPDVEVDPTTQRIYWTDYVNGMIRSADYDGSNAAIEIDGLENPFGLALEIEEVDNTLNVQAEARCHDNKKNTKCKPTSCGALYLNHGAVAYEKDESGELVLDEDGNPIVVAGPTDSICLAAVDDVNGDGVFTWDGTGDEDGDGLTDYEEACEGPTYVCDPDSDDDGVLDGADACPLEGPADPDLGEILDPNGCLRQSQCSDGIDNDGNTFIDFPDDLGCDDILDDLEESALCVADWTCGQDLPICGTGGVGDICICDLDVEGNSFCWANFVCGDPGTNACDSNADCGEGFACVTSCCGQTCAPVCPNTNLVNNFSAEPMSGPDAAGTY